MSRAPFRGIIAALVALSACTVGPDYVRPDAPVPAQYKEAGWKVGEPLDAIDRGAWWSVYKDPLLDDLERQIDISNQNLKAAAAAFEQAEWIVAQFRAGFFPILDLNGAAQRSRTGGGSAAAPAPADPGSPAARSAPPRRRAGCRTSGVRSAVPSRAMWLAPRRAPVISPALVFRLRARWRATICS